MKEVDLGDVPMDRVIPFVYALLGVDDINHVREVRITPDAIYVEMYATDEQGLVFLDGGEMAMKTLTRRIVK